MNCTGAVKSNCIYGRRYGSVRIPLRLGYGPLAGVTIIGMQFLDFFDFLTNSVMMPIAAIAICLFVSKVVGLQKMEEEITQDGQPFRRKENFLLYDPVISPHLCSYYTDSSQCKCLPVGYPCKKSHIQNNSHHSGYRRQQTDHGQARRWAEYS